MTNRNTVEIVTVCLEKTTMTKQQLPNFVGVSEASAGSRHLSMKPEILSSSPRMCRTSRST